MNRIKNNKKNLFYCKGMELKTNVLEGEVMPFVWVMHWPEEIFINEEKTKDSGVSVFNTLAFYYDENKDYQGTFAFSFDKKYFEKLIQMAGTSNPKDFQLFAEITNVNDDNDSIRHIFKVKEIGCLRKEEDNEYIRNSYYGFSMEVPDINSSNSLKHLFRTTGLVYNMDFSLCVE